MSDVIIKGWDKQNNISRGVAVDNQGRLILAGGTQQSFTGSSEPVSSSSTGTQSVSVTNFPTTQSVSGTISIGNFPNLQAVSVSNFPSVQAVSLTTLPSGTNTIGNVNIGNFPSIQPISGSLSIDNFPSIQAVSAATLPLPTGAASESTLSGIQTLFGAVGDVASAVGGLLGRLRLIIDSLNSRTARVDKAGVTSATPNTWTTAIAANSNRRMWRVHNLPTNTSNLEVGYLIDSTNVRTIVLLPGGTIEESLPSMDISPQAIVVRSTVASLAYDGVEA